MRWIIYGDILSRHAVDSLIAALRDAGQEVVEVPSVSRGHRYSPDAETEAESKRRIEAQLPADVLFNFRPEELTPAVLDWLRDRDVATVTWFADDPLLYKINSSHVVESYSLTLHTGREDVLELYEERHGVRGYSFPFWTDDAHYPYGYDPDSADIEVGFLGNCHKRRRSDRYELLASLPWRVRFFGRLADGASDDAGIQAGVLDRAEIPDAIRRFRVAINFSQRFEDVEKRYAFPGLKKFREYFFPSRVVLYAAVGIPTVSLTLPHLDPPLESVLTASDRGDVVDRIGSVIDDREALLELSRRARADFERCLTAGSRVALLLSLLEGPRDHDRPTRANLWRSAS